MSSLPEQPRGRGKDQVGAGEGHVRPRLEAVTREDQRSEAAPVQAGRWISLACWEQERGRWLSVAETPKQDVHRALEKLFFFFSFFFLTTSWGPFNVKPLFMRFLFSLFKTIQCRRGAFC